MCAAVGIRPHVHHPAMASQGKGGSHNRPSLFMAKKPETPNEPSGPPTGAAPVLPRKPRNEPQQDVVPARPPKFGHEGRSHVVVEAEPPPVRRSKRPSLTGEDQPPAGEPPLLSDRTTTGRSPGLRIDLERPSGDGARSTSTSEGPDIVLLSPQSLSPASPTKRKLSVEPDLPGISEDGGSHGLPTGRTQLQCPHADTSRDDGPGKDGKKMKRSISLRPRFFKSKSEKAEEPADSKKARTWNHGKPQASLHDQTRKGGMKKHQTDPRLAGQTMPNSVYKDGGAPGERSDDVRLLHHLTSQCVAFLTQDMSLREEGLFRVPGDQNKIRQMRQQFLTTGRCDFSGVRDPHLVAGLLKLHFRELKFAIVPQGDPTKNLLDAVKTKNVYMAKRCLAKLPITHHQVLKELMRMFEKIAEHKEDNLMCPSVIGRSCGPSIFHSYGVQDAGHVLAFLIEQNRQVLNTSS